MQLPDPLSVRLLECAETQQSQVAAGRALLHVVVSGSSSDYWADAHFIARVCCMSRVRLACLNAMTPPPLLRSLLRRWATKPSQPMSTSQQLSNSPTCSGA